MPSDRLASASRGAVVTMAAVLAGFGSALALERVAHLHLYIVIEAVVLSLSVSRAQRSAKFSDRLIAVAVLPVLAIGASETGRMMSSHPNLGDAMFVIAMAAAIWFRRFGPRMTRASVLVAAPLVAVLILEGPISVISFEAAPLWVALVAVICCSWVTVLQLLAARVGFDRPLNGRTSGLRRDRPPATKAKRRLIDVPTRMALQMGVALAVAFVVGRSLWPEHWTWVVLTAFIVCSGARGRGDVVLKAVLRAGGAAVGTVVATGLSGLFGAHEVGAIVTIFIFLGVATWLREISYAYWAACVTASISLLYGWFGVFADGLLWTRLEGIAVGAAIGIASSWLILPVRTQDAFRRRCGESLSALSDLFAADWNDLEGLGQFGLAFSQSAERLEEVAGPHRAARHLPIRWWPDASRSASALDAIHSCVGAVRELESAIRRSGCLAAGNLEARRAAVSAKVAALRCVVGRRLRYPYWTAPHSTESESNGEDKTAELPSTQDQVLVALVHIDSALDRLGEVVSSLF